MWPGLSPRKQRADETGVSLDRIDWLVRFGILRPRQPDSFRVGDVFRVKEGRGGMTWANAMTL